MIKCTWNQQQQQVGKGSVCIRRGYKAPSGEHLCICIFLFSESFKINNINFPCTGPQTSTPARPSVQFVTEPATESPVASQEINVEFDSSYDSAQLGDRKAEKR